MSKVAASDSRMGNSIVYTRDNGSKRVRYFNEAPSLTKQSMSDDCDINAIMARFEKTGVLTSVNESSPRYGEYADVVDYDESLRIVMDAQEAFADLPAKVRAKFENDPGQFLDFVGNPANAEEMVTLGLSKPVVAASSQLGNHSSLDIMVPTDTNS